MIPEQTVLVYFTLASVAMLISPGPAVLYIVARSVDQGRWAGIVSSLGISFGTLFHIAAAAWGLSAILVRSAAAFNVVKYLGAAYLVYLGVKRLLSKEDPAQQPELTARRSHGRIFWQGVVVNLLNPKTALFFFAFLPQFVDPGRGSAAGQVLFLGVYFVILGLLSDSVWAVAAGSAGHWLRNHAGFLKSQRYVTASIYVALGVATAFSGSRK